MYTWIIDKIIDWHKLSVLYMQVSAQQYNNILYIHVHVCTSLQFRYFLVVVTFQVVAFLNPAIHVQAMGW